MSSHDDSLSNGVESAVENPYISFLVYDHDVSSLGQCLHALFSVSDMLPFEVIVCDDASTDGAWQIACDYAKRYDGLITLCRSHRHIGTNENRKKGRLMCKGRFCVELTSATPFNYPVIANVIQQLESHSLTEHSFISRLSSRNYLPTDFSALQQPIIASGSPLVSICIYNYNYGRYLRECLDSVISQTYENIEICFSDNASDDESWDIAVEYAANYPQKINLTRNRKNFGAHSNLWNCFLNMRGQYLLKLCSDDVLHPEYVELCMQALADEPEAAFVMVHRSIIDDDGHLEVEPPFYDSSCLIPGSEQAAVYMMSSINPSVSQVFYRVEKISGKRLAGNLNDRWFGDRIMDFHICCDAPIIYIKEPLLLHRLHSASDSANIDGNLLQCLGEYVLVHQLADMAAVYPGMEKAQARLPEALDKLGRLSLRYCLRLLQAGDEAAAERYFHLALAISPEVKTETVFETLHTYWASSPKAARSELLDQILSEHAQLINRQYSYSPPTGSVPIQHKQINIM